MDGLNRDQVTALIKGYRERRDSFPGPTLTTAELRQAVKDIEALAGKGGDVVQQVAEAARIRRAAAPNPLKPNPECAS